MKCDGVAQNGGAILAHFAAGSGCVEFWPFRSMLHHDNNADD